MTLTEHDFLRIDHQVTEWITDLAQRIWVLEQKMKTVEELMEEFEESQKV